MAVLGVRVKRLLLNGPVRGWVLGGGQFCLAVALFATGLFLGFSLHDSEIVTTWLPQTNSENFPYVFVGLVALVAGLSTSLFLLFTHKLRQDLHRLQTKVTSLTIFDELTGLINRRHFYDRLEEELDRTRRYGTKLALIMVDIDHFKKVNDELGHPLGDVALAEVARLLKANIRTSDIIARYGGEEFAIIIPAQGKNAAFKVAEKLCNVVEVNDLTLDGPQLKVTISAGVADADDLPAKSEDIKATLIRMADRALICAKKAGRNRVAAHQKNSDRQFKLL